MQVYIIYAIISLIFSGMQNFLFKIISKNNLNIRIYNIYTYFIALLISAIFMFFNHDTLSKSDILFISILGFINIIPFTLSTFSKVKSLDNIDTVIFFPIYKSFGVIITVLVSLLFFKETLNLKEIIGIILGILVPISLVNKKEKARQKNIFLGIIFIFITVILTTISNSATKELMNLKLDIFFYIFI